MAKKKNPSMTLALPELPEDIQRRILLSLPPKAFARLSVLSKSWLSFYNSTRSSFDITFKNDKDRVPEELTQEIMNFDKSFSASLLREKLTVDEFNINMKLSRYLNVPQLYSHDEWVDLVYKWLDVVYKWLAALFTTDNIVKVLRIQIRSIGDFYFPQEILSKIFSNESLQVLHLECTLKCILDRVHLRKLGCLRVLSLYNVFIDSKSTDRLLSVCPNLEQLTLSNELVEQHIIIKGLHKLKYLDISMFAYVRIEEAPALENVVVVAYDGDDRTIINAQLCRRIKLFDMLVNSERTARHIQQVVSCLPELENLTLTVECATDIRISSRCLKNLTLYMSEFQHDEKMVEINAPNLRCYVYGSEMLTFSPHLMMNTGMLEVVSLDLTNIEIDESDGMLELRKALQIIEHLKLGVHTVKLRPGNVHVEAARLDQKSNVSATRVIEMLNAGAVKFVEMLNTGADFAAAHALWIAS